MVRQRENDVCMKFSISLLILLHVNMASLLNIVDNCILINNFLLFLYVSQQANAFN